ncbi:hypothetical protein [Streptomyces daqingensis]|nr:hypothetical protein [Streptomyces daqingensis]
MQAVLTSLIAVIGTLLGAGASFLIQKRTAERSEQFQREERLRQEQLTSSKDLATALHEYRSAQHARWHRAHEDWDSPAALAARTESYRRRTVAWQALAHVRLLFNDVDLLHDAQTAFDCAGDMHRAVDKADLESRDDMARTAIDKYLEVAAHHVRGQLARRPIIRPPEAEG